MKILNTPNNVIEMLLAEKDKYKSSIKFDSDFVGNKAHAIEDMLNKKWESLTSDFLKKWEKNYNRQCHQINRDTSINDKVKKVQLKTYYQNITNSLKIFLSSIQMSFKSILISVLIHQVL